MNESPLMNLVYVLIAAYIGYMYWGDLQASKSGKPNPKAMPGATTAPSGIYFIGAIVALLILAVETGGEILLGVADEQNELVWYFIFASLSAGIVEEVIFRGFLVVENKGRAALVGSCILFSFIFAVLHPYLWEFDYPEDIPTWKFWLADFSFIFTPKAFFTTAILFANSLWFYALRFGSWNQNRSLFPCMLAHAVSNLGVFIVKFFQGSILF